MFETWLTPDRKDSPLSYYNFVCFDPHYINPVPVTLPFSYIILFESLISKYQTNFNIDLKWVDDYGGPTIFSEWSGKAKSTPYSKKIKLLNFFPKTLIIFLSKQTSCSNFDDFSSLTKIIIWDYWIFLRCHKIIPGEEVLGLIELSKKSSE